jgi:hypothetical protein
MTQIPDLILRLEDADGFRVISVEIKRDGEHKTEDGVARIVDDNGQEIAYAVNTTTACDKHVYARATQWSITWTDK